MAGSTGCAPGCLCAVRTLFHSGGCTQFPAQRNGSASTSLHAASGNSRRLGEATLIRILPSAHHCIVSDPCPSMCFLRRRITATVNCKELSHGAGTHPEKASCHHGKKDGYGRHSHRPTRF